eukprot:CAMPEP_0176466742 /NCGR_PEP_ID=MMETSP0127-20121128/38076_1 /TAXON_ID=938130 /ORGANISM="Platyophrya macrostoma, Strain WH" /LENGTH=37 /DNA_ID= /DNA_START= /DNA_END= /DNA_ORIENTATION=
MKGNSTIGTTAMPPSAVGKNDATHVPNEIPVLPTSTR